VLGLSFQAAHSVSPLIFHFRCIMDPLGVL
jgi:hypothetical protein